MAVIPAYTGEVVHKMKDGGVRRFRPKGPMYVAHDYYKPNPIEHFGSGGTRAARLFIGLNVGETPKWKPEDVMNRIYKIRKKQKASGDMSVLTQLGIYEDSEGRRIDEESVQVILLDLSDDPNFVKNILDLADELRGELEQERIIVEIQKGGVVQDVYSATDPRLVAAEST